MFNADDLAQRLDSVRIRYAQSGMQLDGAAEHADLLADVAALGVRIEAIRHDLAELRATDFRRHVPEASHELAAIVSSTAEAADAILETCEQLDEAVANLPEACTTLVHRATTRIFEACGFQDITGQRAAKVDQVLKLIDGEVEHIATIFDTHPASPPARVHLQLLNGPQRDSLGLDQDAIDALLRSSP